MRRNLQREKKDLNSFDKDQANVLAASAQGSYLEQEKLIVLDEEEQNRLDNETVGASQAKIEGKVKDETTELDSRESWQKLAGRTIAAADRLQEISLNQFLLSCATQM